MLKEDNEVTERCKEVLNDPDYKGIIEEVKLLIKDIKEFWKKLKRP